MKRIQVLVQSVVLFGLVLLSCSRAHMESMDDGGARATSAGAVIHNSDSDVDKLRPGQPRPFDSKDMVQKGYKLFPIESGIISYRLDGMQAGTEVLYFDRWGWRSARYIFTNLDMGSSVVQENKLSLYDGVWRYIVDFDAKTGTVTEDIQLKNRALKLGKEKYASGDLHMIKSSGYQAAGSAHVAGMPCDVWKSEEFNTQVWIWNAISLKYLTDTGGTPLQILATEVQEGVAIPEEKFVIPENITMSDGRR